MTQEKIIETLLDFIVADDERAAVGSTTSNEVFNEIALELYRYQFSFNQPFRHFHLNADEPTHSEVMAGYTLVPINAFKNFVCPAVSLKTPYVFTTSGTTGRSKRQKLSFKFRRVRRLYDPWFKGCFVKRDSIEMSILYPQRGYARSSLAHYLTLAIKILVLHESACDEP